MDGCYKDGSSVVRNSEAWQAGRWREGEWALASLPGPSSNFSGLSHQLEFCLFSCLEESLIFF